MELIFPHTNTLLVNNKKVIQTQRYFLKCFKKYIGRTHTDTKFKNNLLISIFCNSQNVNYQKYIQIFIPQSFLWDFFYYFIFAPSLKACPIFSPSTRYEFVIESKVISSNLSTSICPFSFNTASSTNVLIISAITL